MDDVLVQLRDQFDIAQVPFTYPGSRILIFRQPEKHRLYVKLAERLTHIFPGLEAYLTRDPFINDLCLTQDDKEALDFQIVTYPHLIQLKTKAGLFELAFEDKDTFHIHLPKNKQVGISFKVHADQFEKLETGGFAFAYRNLKYETNAEMLVNEHERGEGFLNVNLVLKTGEGDSIRLCVYDDYPIEQPLPPFEIVLNSSKNAWEDWFSRIPEVDPEFREKYYYAWWVMAANQIDPKGNITETMDVPSKCGYIGAWLWDNALHTLAYRYVDPVMAHNQIRGMLIHQQSNGMLPDAIFDDGIVTEIDHPIEGRVTKPPILAWAAMKIHEMAPAKQFVIDIYQPLVRWSHWWFPDWQENPDALAQYSHPYMSGMDDHPTWERGMPVVSPDLNTYLYLQMNALAEMALIIDKPQEANDWKERAQRLLNAMIEKLWDDKAGLFWAYHDGEPIKTKSIINLFPLWTGKLPHKINQRLIDHLRNEREFGSDFAIPVVSRDDFDFSPDKMWRGPIWANINYFMIEALQKIGQDKLAGDIRKNTLDLIMKNEGIYEYYNAMTGKPGHHAMPMFSWTAAVFIDLAIQATQDKRKNNGSK